MAATTMVHVRLDENLKAHATETLAAMGLAVCAAVRVFLTRVVADKELPFAIKAPNAATQAAMDEARFDSAEALIDDLEKASHQ